MSEAGAPAVVEAAPVAVEEPVVPKIDPKDLPKAKQRKKKKKIAFSHSIVAPLLEPICENFVARF